MGRPDWETKAVVASYPAESLAWFVDYADVIHGNSEFVDVEVPAGTIGRLAGAVLTVAPADTPAGDWIFQALQLPDPGMPAMFLTHLLAEGDETMDLMFVYGELTCTGAVAASPSTSEGWRHQIAEVRITPDVPLQLQFYATSMTAGLLSWSAVLGLWVTEVG